MAQTADRPAFFKALIWLFALVVGGLSVGARGADFGARSKIALGAVADVASLPPGGTGTIAVQVDIAPGWHIQSAQPHDKELSATVLTPDPAAGVVFGEPLYPEHAEIPSGLLPPAEPTIAVYEEHVVFLVPFTIAADARPGPITLGGKINSQACSTVCNEPVDTAFAVTIVITPAGTAVVGQNQAVFEAARKQKWLAVASRPATKNAPATVPTQSADQGQPGKTIHLLSNDEQISLIKARHYAPNNEVHYSLGVIILFALVGGAILNVMPCVLPVIPLKVLGLVQQAHGDRRLAILHGLTFSAGIISLFVGLAVVLKVMGLFYGQQFQSPWFIISMAFLVLALALSMLGVWTIQAPQAVYAVDKPRSGYLGSFSSGLLATLLATPCSAPYLGPVLGWALVQRAWVTAFALGLVGVGMSLPYLILAAFPGLLGKMPKAGRWSELLKQGLGIVMMGVGVYLILLLPNSTLWPFVFYGAVVLGLVCWGWGQIPTGTMEPRTIWGIRVLIVLLGLGAGSGIYAWGARTFQESQVPVAAAGELIFLPDAPSTNWLPFNLAISDETLKSGRPVVVDWTANWCINCRVLEARVLRTKAVEDAFVRNGAVLLKADETVDNPPVTLLNEELGGSRYRCWRFFRLGIRTRRWFCGTTTRLRR